MVRKCKTGLDLTLPSDYGDKKKLYITLKGGYAPLDSLTRRIFHAI